MPPFPQDGPPTLGLIGFGAFARLAAGHLRPWFRLRAYDPALPCAGSDAASGVALVPLAEAAGCDLVVLAMPVERLAEAVAAVRPHLRPGALVLDVCSVKSEPARLLAAELPAWVEVVGTHPLFGPASAAQGVKGLKIALCPIRGRRTRRVAAFLRAALGLKVVITTPEEHDREAAVVQGLTHLVARVLVQMEPLPSRLTTASFDLLMGAVAMVRHDPQALFLAIERANPYAAAARERFFTLAEALRNDLEG